MCYYCSIEKKNQYPFTLIERSVFYKSFKNAIILKSIDVSYMTSCPDVDMCNV